MSIDEAIAKYNKLANNDRTCYPGEAQQLAEWLEELKELRNMTAGHLYAVAFNRGYLKAEKEVREKTIDDFANRISECLGVENATKYGNKNAEQQRMSYDTLMKYEIADAIEDVAEQLKAGIVND